MITTSWDIQPNTPYRIRLGHPLANSSGNVTWNYNVVNVGDLVSMNVNAKIHNDHCKVNTNTIKINYICKVDQELSDYCGTPVSSNTGFKQDDGESFYTGYSSGGDEWEEDQSNDFNNVFSHAYSPP